MFFPNRKCTTYEVLCALTVPLYFYVDPIFIHLPDIGAAFLCCGVYGSKDDKKNRGKDFVKPNVAEPANLNLILDAVLS